MIERTECKIRMIFFAAACGICLAVGACSDNKGHEPSPAKEPPAQTAPATSAEVESQSATPTPAAAPASTGSSVCATMLTAKCTECHSMERVCEKLGKKSKSRWQRTVTRMIERGAKISPAEAATILDCLDSEIEDLQTTCQ